MEGAPAGKGMALMEERSNSGGYPTGQGLYDPSFERDACGIGFIANIQGERSHDIILKGIQILVNLQHRGASGSDPITGDGAGVLIQIPHAFFERECVRLGFTLPLPGEYGIGMVFLPVERNQRLICEGILERIVREEGLTTLGWRDTPIAADAIGRIARASQPYIQQIFIRHAPGMDQDTLERKLYIIRKRAEAEVEQSDVRDKSFFAIPSLSSRTIVYKGLLLATQIASFYKELSDPLTVKRPVPGAPAFLDQYVPDLEAGPSVPLHLPQRRDQYSARQQGLDGRAPVHIDLAAVRGRHGKAFPHRNARRERFRDPG